MSYVFVGHKTTNKNNGKLQAYITRENVCIERIFEEPIMALVRILRYRGNGELKFN